MQYTLPREAFEILVETFKSKEKAEKFASAIEEIINYAKDKSQKEIIDKKEILKIELKEELKNELVTKELFEERFNLIEERFNLIEERFNLIEERFKSINFKLNIFITITLIILTFANPTFVEIIKQIFK